MRSGSTALSSPRSQRKSSMANKRQEWLTCIICGTGFAPYNQVQLTCSKKCSRELAVRRAAIWRQENHIPAIPEQRICPCGKSFRPRNSTHKFCSRKCASKKQKRQIKDWQNTRGRDSRLRSYYGITHKDYERMYHEQGGRCLICKEEFETLCVDHDHQTGKIRGLLCTRCNAALGGFKEDIERLHTAILYIEQHKDDEQLD
jgi:hypothetical protein